MQLSHFRNAVTLCHCIPIIHYQLQISVIPGLVLHYTHMHVQPAKFGSQEILAIHLNTPNRKKKLISITFRLRWETLAEIASPTVYG